MDGRTVLQVNWTDGRTEICQYRAVSMLTRDKNHLLPPYFILNTEWRTEIRAAKLKLRKSIS